MFSSARCDDSAGSVVGPEPWMAAAGSYHPCVMATFGAYGVTFDSEFELPYPEGAGPADVTIRTGEVPPLPDDALRFAALAAVTDDGVSVELPDVARFRADADLIRVQPLGEEAHARALLVNTVIGYCLALRSPVLQAAAVARGEEAVCLLAHTGLGRSTMAALLAADDLEVVTDDWAVIDPGASGAVLRPGGGELRLWPDVIRHLGADPGGLDRVRPGIEKRRVPTGQPPDGTRIVGGVVIASHNHDRFEPPVELSGADRFAALTGHLYAASALHALGRRAGAFAHLVALAESIPMVRIVRPSGGQPDFEGSAEAVREVVESWLT